MHYTLQIAININLLIFFFFAKNLIERLRLRGTTKKKNPCRKNRNLPLRQSCRKSEVKCDSAFNPRDLFSALDPVTHCK